MSTAAVASYLPPAYAEKVRYYAPGLLPQPEPPLAVQMLDSLTPQQRTVLAVLGAALFVLFVSGSARRFVGGLRLGA